MIRVQQLCSPNANVSQQEKPHSFVQNIRIVICELQEDGGFFLQDTWHDHHDKSHNVTKHECVHYNRFQIGYHPGSQHRITFGKTDDVQILSILSIQLSNEAQIVESDSLRMSFPKKRMYNLSSTKQVWSLSGE